MDLLDQIFELLSEERRRYALYYLEQQDGPVPVNDVAEQVAEWESNGSTATIPKEKFNNIKVKLLHNDLPKASLAEYIRYNPQMRTVELTNAPTEINAIISVAEVIEQPDHHP